MTKTEKSFFNAAKAMSELSDHPKYKVGCVVVIGHRIMSSGRNSNIRCHAVQAKLDKEMFGCECPGKVHSEVDALLPLIKSRVDLSKAYIYVYREHKNNTLACARPCSRCMKLIKQCGVKRIYYTSDDGYIREDLKNVNEL